jgi:alpha-L-fucosidase
MISTKYVQPSEVLLPFSDNRGKRWTSEEDLYLVKNIQYMSNYDIGRMLKRSENAVYSRIKKLAFHMIQNGEDPEFVKNNFRLSNEDIDQINSECFVYNQKNNQNSGSKFITSIKNKKQRGYFTAPVQQSPEMVILLEIRSMLRRLLLQSESKRYTQYASQDHESDSKPTSFEINFDDIEKKSEEFAKQNFNKD